MLRTQSPILLFGLGLLLVTLAWDVAGQDRAVMHAWGGANGFALRHDVWLEQWAHEGVRKALTVLGFLWLVLLALGRGPVRSWTRHERLAVGLSAVVALLAVNVIKRASLTSCPWDMAEFGGMAHYVSHWALGVADGGGAHCFPGGHASSALAWLGAAFPALSGRQGRVRRGVWQLAALLGAGAVLGAVQTVRGAHYPSHTLWTMVVCYAATAFVWWAVHAWSAARQRRVAAAYQPSPM